MSGSICEMPSRCGEIGDLFAGRFQIADLQHDQRAAGHLFMTCAEAKAAATAIHAIVAATTFLANFMILPLVRPVNRLPGRDRAASTKSPRSYRGFKAGESGERQRFHCPAEWSIMSCQGVCGASANR